MFLRGLAAVARVGLAGAFAGAVNAWLCREGIPVPAGGTAAGSHSDFAWHIVPAGAIHGALLAALPFAIGLWASRRGLLTKLLLAPPVGWLLGYLSWIPLNRSAFDDAWGKSLTWPFHEEWVAMLGAPFLYFGLVALAYYLAIALGGAREQSLGKHLVAAIGAGVLGSLWWWISWAPWCLSLLHGAIWGSLVGTAAWSVIRREASGPAAHS